MTHNYNLAILFTGIAVGHALHGDWLGVGLMSAVVLLNIGFHLLLVKDGWIK